MRILRHSKIAVTMEVYTRFRPMPPATRFTGSVTGSCDDPLCCSFLLHQDQEAGPREGTGL